MASSSLDGNLYIWDASTGELLLDLVEDEIVITPWAIKWSPDGSKLIGGFEDGLIKIWNTETGEELISFSGHSGGITSFSWSPSGGRVASGSSDGTARVWDVVTGVELYRYNFHTTGLVHWLPDGNRFLVGAEIYPVWNSTEELIDYAKACCIVRSLTPEERVNFGLPPRDN